MYSMTPDHCKKVGTGMAPTPVPFLTPRPDRKRLSLRGSDWGLIRQDHDREVNVQVIVRCRPLPEDEQRGNVSKAINCIEQKKEVIVTQNIANKPLDKVFTFDKVFGPKSQQRSIYDQAIAPLVSEVLEGFNCTVFAYGQTGTGKTYTMEGEGMRSKVGELPAEAGVIPRAVRQIFDKLEAQNADYNIKVTFLELYNEEVTDLLAPEDASRYLDEKQRRTVALLEDAKGCVNIRGLEEENVYTATDIYNLLERGAAKRRSVDTLLNKRSSRSHSVFTITIYVRESTVGGEELIKCGKLNLVDLAGSENISRSGAREGRAREAGEINKSLFTLGRVINALVDRSVHVPYRDSKLTRLLRESLGGKTKTCIVATISSSAQSLEETLSTLDYAYRAKNIKNRPEANQKVTKAVLLKEVFQEMERLKRDVRAAREKNGVYIPHDRYYEEQAEKKALNVRIEQLEIELVLSRKEAEKCREKYLSEQEQKLDLQSELIDCKGNLENTSKSLQDLGKNHTKAISELKEKEFLISKLLNSEGSLIDRAKELRSNLDNATEDIAALHAKIEQKAELQAQNHELILTLGSQLDKSLKDLHKNILGSVSQEQNQIRCLEEHMGSFLACKEEATKVLERQIDKMSEAYTAGANSIRELVAALKMNASNDLGQMHSELSCHTLAVENFLDSAVLEAKEVISCIKSSISEQTQLSTFWAQQQEAGLQRKLVAAQKISEETIGFFDNVCLHSYKLMSNLEESQKMHQEQILNLEKSIKETSAKEEREAAEKIAAILAGLTARNTTAVSEAMKSMLDMKVKENKAMHKGLSSMQQVLDHGKNAARKYVKEAERHFLSDAILITHSQATIDEHLMGCSKMVDHSSQQWEEAGNYIRKLNNHGLSAVGSSINKVTEGIEGALNQYTSVSMSMDKEFEVGASSLLDSTKDSLKLDCQAKEEIDSLSTQSLDQLNSIQAQHKANVTSIRNRVEQCLTKEYMVDREEAPEKRLIPVPSMASIEMLRTPVFKEILRSMESEIKLKSGKLHQRHQSDSAAMLSPPRSPFTDIN